MQHILKITPGFATRLDLNMIERRVTYEVWWASSCVLLTSNEAQARRKAKEMNGLVRVVVQDRKV